MSQPIDPGGALELFASMGVSSLALTGVLIIPYIPLLVA